MLIKVLLFMAFTRFRSGTNFVGLSPSPLPSSHHLVQRQKLSFALSCHHHCHRKAARTANLDRLFLNTILLTLQAGALETFGNAQTIRAISLLPFSGLHFGHTGCEHGENDKPAGGLHLFCC